MSYGGGGMKRAFGGGGGGFPGHENNHHFKRQRIAPPRDFDDDDLKQQQRVIEDRSPGKEEDGASSAARGHFRPAMMSFKTFLNNQDDNITDEEALLEFNKYKKEFNRQQLNEFFVAHKDEEWMQDKYHPDNCQLKKAATKEAIEKRLEVFMELHTEGIIDQSRLEKKNSEKIEILLDTFVARLEGSDVVGLLDPDDQERESLCKTTSLQLRTIPPTLKREELLSLLTKYPGYLRLSLSDPSPETRWKRRGLVTYKREAKIKEICFNLSTQRIKDSELSPVVNKDLSQRIRTVSGLANDKSVVRCCLQLANRLVTQLDKQWGLWDTPENIKQEDDVNNPMLQAIGGGVNNPLLENIAEYLVEEMSAEEEELLGSDSNTASSFKAIECDDELTSRLDKLILYLRLVHSVDLYNAAFYATEEERPNRCGIFHVRDNVNADLKVTENELADYKEEMGRKVKTMADSWKVLSDDEIQELGPKNETEAVEILIQSHTEDLGNNKHLCSLCGKKFKGEEFVKKHIANKHEEKLEAVKKEVLFYNNYIKDPKRPALPEKPKPKAPPPKPVSKAPVKERIKENIPVSKPRGSIKDRLGFKNVTSAYKDPRTIVDYSDVEFSDIFS
eukprot:TRINITY_DN460_c0_g1_i1.p1 TRINITY_DN460_c0_g1~~TRINITY_DN460_c0_g1_i1.p1  ORF type:complete len:617 (-),score=197.12 TRINITY_DN460_c0_g1_i1:130-1980(-)